MDRIAHEIAGWLLEIEAVGFSPEKPIRFKSGILSPVYIDNRCLPFHPRAWHAVIEGFRALIDTSQLEYDVVAGVAVGGVPHSSALAYVLSKPSVFIRKEAKEHGKQKRVEGGDVGGRRTLLVEDLVTTGGSSLSAVDALREEGADVTDVLAIVSYAFAEGKRAFAEAGVRLQTLTNFQVIIERAIAAGRLDQKHQQVVQQWFDDPQRWTAERGG